MLYIGLWRIVIRSLDGFWQQDGKNYVMVYESWAEMALLSAISEITTPTKWFRFSFSIILYFPTLNSSSYLMNDREIRNFNFDGINWIKYGYIDYFLISI